MTLRGVQDRLNDVSPRQGLSALLIALRNLLAHGGGLGPSDAQVLLSNHLPRTQAIIDALIEVPSVVVGAVLRASLCSRALSPRRLSSMSLRGLSIKATRLGCSLSEDRSV